MARGQISSRKGGKLVDTWHYQYDGVAVDGCAENKPDDTESGEPEDDQAIRSDLWQTAGQIKVPIRLLLHKKFAESDKPPLATKEVWFSVESENPKISLEGPDIEALRVAMWEKLDAHYAVKWERYYKVTISPGYKGASLSFEYDSIEKGTGWDGALLMREYKFGEGRVIRPWPGEFRDGQGLLLACIPNTPENTRALEEFAARIHELRRKLAGFLRPDVIMATLANLNAIALLPTPSKNSNDDERSLA